MEEQNIGTKKLDKNKKIILTIIAVLILTIGVTLAYIIAQLQDEARGNVNVTSDAVDILRFEVDKDITLNPTQFNVTEGGDNLSDTAVGSAILRANSTNDSATYTYYVYFQINSNDYIYTTEEQTPEIVLTITNPEGNPVTSISGLNYVTSGGVSGFDITTKSGLYEVAELYEIISNSSTHDTIQEWEFTVSFINLDTNQYENGGKTLEAEVILSKEEYKQTLANYIINQYTVDGENGLYYHDADLANGAEDYSYRYSGANPNNYVCFGSDASTCPNDNLYRIIGVFNDTGEYQVKLIKHDYANSNLLGTDGDYSGFLYTEVFGESSYYDGTMNQSSLYVYYWNFANINATYEVTNYYNVWSYSALNTVNLNTNFLNSFDSTWQNMIATTEWKVGGMGYDAYESLFNVAHDYEINNPNSDIETTYNAKIGLMYVSDYLYAAQPEDWNTTMGNYVYEDNANPNNNWMYMGLHEWTISRYSDDSYAAFDVSDGGNVDGNLVSDARAVRPSFSLSSSTTLSGGSGTADDPFTIQG